MKIILDKGWELKGWWPNEWIMGRSMENNQQFDGVTPWIEALVPGSIYMDLQNAGLIENPYYGMNSLKCEWVSSRAWMYKNRVRIGSEMKGKTATLIFHGIDYAADFFLNGQLLGRHEGMFIPIEFNVTPVLNYDEENEIIVVIHPAPDEMDQIGYTSLTKTQKARFGYKWDFGTKLVDLGIWKQVELSFTNGCRITDACINPVLSDTPDECEVDTSLSIEGTHPGPMILQLEIFHDGSSVASVQKEFLLQHGNQNIKACIILPMPDLWYPNGYGKQSLYKAAIRIIESNGCLCDSKEIFFGIRKLDFIRNEGAPEDSLPYTISVNDRRIFIKGWNFVPTDHMYGHLNMEKYEQLIMLAVKANVNLLRVWGGGLIEREEFYDLCDRYGIMVWQEFIQSSSGIDNEASVDNNFLQLLKKTAEAVIRQKRNHVSLTIWCGGNELMDSGCRPLDKRHTNICMLKELVEELSPVQLFLPTSASGPSQWLNPNKIGMNLHHDIHGQWRYLGVEKHYTYYNANDCLIHTEFGVQGCASLQSLELIMEQKDLWPVIRDNPTWKHHGAAWWYTEDDVKNLFGKVDCIGDFVKASQFIQAEGLRYIVEAGRRRKYKCSGVIPWQMNEPWPNAVCTNAIDYNGIPKLAYYLVRKAYGQLHVSFEYDKLVFPPGEALDAVIHVHNSLDKEAELDIAWDIRNIYGESLYSGRVRHLISADSCNIVCPLRWVVPKLPEDIFLITVKAYAEDIQLQCNDYLFSADKSRMFHGVFDCREVILQADIIECNKDMCLVRVSNRGRCIALFTQAFSSEKSPNIFCAQNGSCIEPGETIEYVIEFQTKQFSDTTQIYFEALNSRKVNL